MGIVNCTPDSFSGDGLWNKSQATNIDIALQQASDMIKQGADIIDVGGESTRPDAVSVSLEEELVRVIPVISAIRKAFPEVLVSIDTLKASVAMQALQNGANIINDISGGIADPAILCVAAEYDAPIVLNHSQYIKGKTGSREEVFREDGPIVETVNNFFKDQVNNCFERGVKPSQIILDPGIGFGKTLEQNFSLIEGLDSIVNLGYPVLLGASRKSFIGRTTGEPVDKRLPGSLAAAVIGLMKGVQILRVHDVPETVQAVCIAEKIRS